MGKWTELVCSHTGERCYYMRHASGLPIYVWPKDGYASAYAVFATDYGAIDTAYRDPDSGKTVELPAGIAHYLEHKLFENEECDAFERYAATGANANAYTSFDHTAYLFSCTQHLTESLEILLDFVQDPYFTEQTVEKERGIIGQEIRMCEDSPSRTVFCNLLEALYHHHPVRIDIAGTVESIAQITPELLYGCYESFYDLQNMVLAVSGNVTCEQVESVADRLLKPSKGNVPRRVSVDEPKTAAQPRIEVRMPVAEPLFYLGYKVPLGGVSTESASALAAAEVLQELLGGRANPLYAELMRNKLINTSFGLEYFNGPGYGVWIVGGESANPDAVCEAFRAEIARLKRDGITDEEFEAARNAVYGRLVSQLDNVESCGDWMLEAHFAERSPFVLLDEVAALDIQSVYRRVQTDFDTEASSLSLVLPLDEKG